MNRERLQQMVTMLRELPEDVTPKFHLRVWNCGTTACAVGHACLYPPFKEQGLAWSEYWGTPTFNGWESWGAVTTFFCLSNDQAEHLFYDASYPEDAENTTALDVADRIEKLMTEV